MTAPHFEVRLVLGPTPLNQRPYFTPVGVRADRTESRAFGGSLATARRKARRMSAELAHSGAPLYVRVYIEVRYGV